ncbi:MAG: selenocysteine-specific translation elongation factor [Gammaproteobacteria bacterium]
MIVATAGHVDHGKTLLVRALTGVDTDRLPEEQARGLTIDLGFAYRDLGDGRVTGFVDVPGHERFVRTMVAGVSGIDVVLFIIAADDGPMPQTAEHLAILDLLGVSRGVIALTKIDRVDAARVAEVSAQCRALFAPTALADCALVPVSAVSGTGIDTLRDELLAVAASLPPRASDGNFRLAVDRSFVLKGAGRVVTGTVFSGSVGVEDEVCHLPGAAVLRVRGIHAQNRETTVAVAGDRCALNLAGSALRDAAPARGDWITAPGSAFVTRRLEARVRVLAAEARALANRSPVHVHLGAADVTARLVTVDGGAIEPGSEALAQLQLDRPLHAVHGDRFVLRDQSARRTLGGGSVVDPQPDVRGRNRAERLAVLAAMQAEDIDTVFDELLKALPEGLDLARFAASFNLDEAAREALFARAAVVVVECDGVPRGFLPSRMQALEAAVVPALGTLHAAHPERAGMTSAELRQALPERLRPWLLEVVLARVLAHGLIERRGGLLCLPGHTARRDPGDAALWKRVRRLLDAPGHRAPVVHDMLEPLGIDLKTLEAFLARATRAGDVVRVSARRYFLPAAMTAFEATVHELARAQPEGTFSVADFRDRTGIGRNAVVEILEYFDRIGLTRREGQVRKVIRQGA